MNRLQSYGWIFLVSLPLFYVISCRDVPKQSENEIAIQQSVEEEEPVITHSDFKGIWEQIKNLWERRDPEIIPTIYAKTFERISPSGTSTNVEELTAEFNVINNAYPDMKLSLDDYAIDDNTILVYWSASGTFTGELLGTKGNGKPFKNLKGISILTFEKGKIVKDDSYWNALEVFSQAGYKMIEAVE